MNDERVSSRPVTLSAIANGDRERKLPRRDWVLLPVLSLLTICLLSVSSELVARRTLRLSIQPNSCLALNDPSAGVRGVPNCVCFNTSPDNESVEYRFNSCGHRAGMECKPKTPGTYRIVMVGSSFGLGGYVQRDKSFAALLPQELSRRTARQVELYNESMFWGSPRNVALSFNDALEAQPDMILWPLTAWDMYDRSPWDVHIVPAEPGFIGQTRYRVKQAIAMKSIPEATSALSRTFHDLFSSTQTHSMMRQLLYQSQSEYVRLYLSGSDEQGGNLKAEPSAEWKRRLQRFELNAAEVEARARAAGVPLVAVLVPNRAQAAMISMGEWPAGFDPYKLDNQLRAIIASHGGTYIDILPGYRNIPNPERGYFPLDGHPNADGHRIISLLLAKELTGGAVPALQVVTQPQVAQGQGR